MREVPAWVLRLSLWDLVGVVAYSQLFTLFETLVIFLGLLLVSAVLPARFFRSKFLAISSAIVFLTSLWFVFLHYSDQLFKSQQAMPWLVSAIVYILLLSALYLVIRRSQKLEMSINSFVGRLAVLSFLYLFIDFLSIVIVIVRNV